MSKKKTTKPEAENPEVENPQVEQPETEQPETEQPETEQPETEQPDIEQPETEQSETEQPEVEQTEQANTQPDYVKDLLEKGVAVLQGRSRGELDEMLAAIPSDIHCYAGPVGYYVDKGLYRIQVNRKEE